MPPRKRGIQTGPLGHVARFALLLSAVACGSSGSTAAASSADTNVSATDDVAGTAAVFDSDLSDVPDVPNVPDLSEVADAPDVPEIPDVPDAPEPLDTPNVDDGAIASGPDVEEAVGDTNVGPDDVDPVADMDGVDLDVATDVGSGDTAADVMAPPSGPTTLDLPDPTPLDVLPGESAHALAALPNDGLVVVTQHRFLMLDGAGALIGQRLHGLTAMTKAHVRATAEGRVAAPTGVVESTEQAYLMNVWNSETFDVTSFVPSLRPAFRATLGNGDGPVTLADGMAVVWDEILNNHEIFTPTQDDPEFGWSGVEPPELRPILRVIDAGGVMADPVSYTVSDAQGPKRGAVADAVAAPTGGVTFLRLTFVGETFTDYPYGYWLGVIGLELVRTTPAVDETVAWTLDLTQLDYAVDMAALSGVPPARGRAPRQTVDRLSRGARRDAGSGRRRGRERRRGVDGHACRANERRPTAHLLGRAVARRLAGAPRRRRVSAFDVVWAVRSR